MRVAALQPALLQPALLQPAHQPAAAHLAVHRVAIHTGLITTTTMDVTQAVVGAKLPKKGKYYTYTIHITCFFLYILELDSTDWREATLHFLFSPTHQAHSSPSYLLNLFYTSR